MNKYEQLIDLIINENKEEARKLFHTIVVEKSREIYESLIDEEDFEEGFGHDEHDEVTDLVDEVEMDEDMSAMHEDEEFDMDSEELPMDDEMGDEEMDMGDEMGAGEEELEDRVVDLEDALDELKAEFDRLMADEAGEEEHSDEEMDMDSEEGDEEEELDEIYTRNKRVVKEYVTPVKHDFNSQRGESGQMAGTGAHSERQGGRNKTSVVAGKNDMGGKAIASKGGNADQDGGKPVKASNEYTKGEGKLPGAGKFANVAGKDGSHSAYKHKEAAYGSGKQSDATGNMAGTGRNTPKQGETNVKSPLGRK
jgi:hypothetical protein